MMKTSKILTLIAFSTLISFLYCLPVFAQTDIDSQIKYKEELVQTLKNEIQQIDSEMVRCEKAKKGWVAATVIGSAGVVATGTAAIVQGVKLNEKKQEKTGEKK